MSVLLKEIKRINPTAGNKLERLKFCTDSELKQLTRQDLQELFPGEDNLRLRKTIFETIHKQRPIGLLLNEMKNFIPDESLRAALSSTGVLVDYLHILKEVKAQVDNVQTFLDAHISLLEDIKKPSEGRVAACEDISSDPKNSTKPQYDSSSTSVAMETSKSPPQNQNSLLSSFWNSAFWSAPVENPTPPPENPPQRSQFDSSGTSQASTGDLPLSVKPTASSPQMTKKTISYKWEISGNTLNAHLQILDRVRSQDDSSVSLHLVEGSTTDSDVTFLFCPIVSRAGTDVETAMKRVKDDKQVILATLRHSHEVKSVAPQRTLSKFPNVVLHVTLFFHDTVNGLLNCQENTDAISEIRKELLKRSREMAAEPVVPEYGNSERFSPVANHRISRSNSEKKSHSIFSKRFLI